MSDINLDFTVSTSNIQVTVDTNEITFTPTDIQLAVFAAGLGLPGGSVGQLQYNNGGVIAGVGNTSYANGNLSLGDISNVKIAGGSNNYAILTDGNGNLSFASIANANYANLAGAANVAYAVNSSDSNVIITGGLNGYFLQTDGTGNLTWAAGTGGGGNGSPGGANTQIQYNDAGAFGGNVGFTFNEVTGNVAIPGALSINGNLSGAGNISVTSNVTAGNLVGNLTANIITVNTTANLGSVNNVKISGGSNGQVLTTDGNSNLSYTTINTGTSWTNTANIAVGDIFVGSLGSSNIVAPGNTTVVNPAVPLTNWAISNTGYPAAQGVNYSGGYIWMHGGNGTVYANTAYYTVRGDLWNSTTTPFPAYLPEKGANNYVILRVGSTNNSAYSNTLTSWTNVALPSTRSWNSLAYGNGVFIAVNSDLNSNTVAVSTNDGVAWTSKTVNATRTGTITYGGNAFLYVFGIGVLANNARYTNDNGNTWSNITLGNINSISTAYGNGKFMVVHTAGPNANSGSFTTVHSSNGVVASSGIVPIYPADVTYANGYFIVSSLGSTQNNKIAYTNDEGNNWTTVTTATPANTVLSGSITYSPNQNILMLSRIDEPGNAYQLQISANPTILITDNTGNLLNANAAPAGTYKNLGGITGNVGTLWTRTA